MHHLSFFDMLHAVSGFLHSSLLETLLHTSLSPSLAYVAYYHCLLTVNWVRSQPLRCKQQNIYIQCFHLSNAINPYDHVYSLVTSIVVVCQIVKWSARTIFLHEILLSNFAGNTRFIVLLINLISVSLCFETRVVDQKKSWSKLTVVVSQIFGQDAINQSLPRAANVIHQSFPRQMKCYTPVFAKQERLLLCL